ncbi:MAG: SpoIIE family protein phosphatase [Planctomycetota bacterium]|jgi:sigma-B regulation protein RsbU (phosphoserine phosphatase)
MEEQGKTTTKLIISGPIDDKEVLIGSKGATLGRSPDCDIVLDNSNISRLHARIFQDPFGRWIIEDLESQNGVLVEGKHIKAQAILPNQKISIRPFTLSLSQGLEQRIAPDSSIQANVSVVDKGLEEDIVSYKADQDGILSVALIRRLNKITGHLLELHSPLELYSEASYSLAKMLDALVAFVRLAPASGSSTGSHQILACHFGKDATKDAATQTSNIHLSKRVLDTVRSTNTPVMAKSGPSSDRQLVLTISDEVTPHIVFSAPINNVEGTLDVLYLDMLENKSPKEMFDFVEAMARQINAVQKSLVSSEAKAQRLILDQQLALARDIQTNLIPSELHHGFDVDVAVCYEPAMWVGGDYYDVWSLADGRIAFTVADVSGKGLPAAMIMSNLQAALRTTMAFCTELSTVVEYVNQHLCQNLCDDMFVTFFIGLFDPSTNTLSYVNAGHIPPLIKQSSDQAQPLGEVTNLPLGIFKEAFKMQVDTISPNTSLLVVTDGITEASSPDDELFGMECLAKLMTDFESHSAQELVQTVIRGVTDFRKTVPQQDDITVLALINRTTTRRINPDKE